MITLITPVGTSLFTNYLDKNASNSMFSRNYDRIKKEPASNWNKDRRISEAIKNLGLSSEDFIRSSGIKASAELQSTAKIQNELQAKIKVHFLASDTIASRLAAEILRDQINNPNFILGRQIEAKFNSDPTVGKVDVIPNLQVNNRTDFSRDGMPNLFHKINDIKDWEAGGNQNLAINITAGYGATLPYLTIFGQLERVPLYYNFEASNELIVIPQAPLAINWDLIKRHARVLAQIDKGIDAHNWPHFKKTNHQAVEELDAFIWWDISAGACLSPIGVIFWEQYLKSHFVVELTKDVTNDTIFERMVQELYRRLNKVLSPNDFTSPNCYQTIRDLKDQNDLNHTGPVPRHNIFIFKWTDDTQRRLMYSFEVNGRVITRIKIYNKRDEHLNAKQYEDWKDQISRNHSTIVFATHTFETPTES